MKITFLNLFFLSTVSFAQEKIIETFFIDLNKDQKAESIVYAKNKGLDFLKIFNDEGKKIFEQELVAMGYHSKIMKITQIKFSGLQECLLMNYFQGITGVSNLKQSTRLYSFCYLSSNLSQMYLQDLGYVEWDYRAIPSYQQLKNMSLIKDIVVEGDPSAILLLKDNNRSRSWNYSIKNRMWIKFPERKYAQYGIKPSN